MPGGPGQEEGGWLQLPFALRLVQVGLFPEPPCVTHWYCHSPRHRMSQGRWAADATAKLRSVRGLTSRAGFQQT